MQVKVGTVVIPDAEVKRFIDVESGLPLSMIKVTYTGEGFKEIGEAFLKTALIPFECEIIKTQVIVHASSHKENVHEYIFQERAADVPCGFRLSHTDVGNEKAIMLPENAKDTYTYGEQIRELPYIRLILKRYMPAKLLK
jgi:hypothetical protein